MKSLSNEIKRKIKYETACINFTLVGILAGAFALVCIINSIANVKSAVYKKFAHPSLVLSPFWCIFIWVLMSALFGAALAIALSTPTCNGKNKTYIVLTAASAFVLCNAWIPLIYSAASFFIATLVSLVIFICAAGLFTLYGKISRLAAILDIVFAVWIVYVFYFSLAMVFTS